MTNDDLRQIKDVIGYMRFMQAAAMAASGVGESKDSVAYMKNLARLDKLIEAELKGGAHETDRPA